MKSDEFKVKLIWNLAVYHVGVILNGQLPLEFLRMAFGNVVNRLPAGDSDSSWQGPGPELFQTGMSYVSNNFSICERFCGQRL